MSQAPPKFRWCFTLNNYTENDWTSITDKLHNVAKYAVVGRETGAEGTPHLQGFFNLKTKARLTAIKRWQGFERAHLEEAKGSDLQNQEYCSKDGDAWSTGEPVNQGQRTDLRRAAELLRESGGSLKRVAEEFPTEYIKYHRGLESYRQLVAPPKPRDFKSEVIVFCGPPGVGKSSRVRELSPTAYTKPVGDWFDGWDGETDLVIDDFHGDIRFSLFKQLIDRYECRVPIKGGFVNARPQRIFITSNLRADEWYNSEKIGMAKDAIHRRITSYKWLVRNEQGELEEQDVMDGNEIVKINF